MENYNMGCIGVSSLCSFVELLKFGETSDVYHRGNPERSSR